MAGYNPVKDAPLVLRLKRIGNKMPIRTIIAARWAGLPIPLAAAILEKETGGGTNEFGHDPTIYVGAGTVTKAKYLAYKKQRNATGLCQGVGPVQLTNATFQDLADKLGGCWSPVANMKVGFGALANTIRRDGLKAAVTAYNGSGPAAEAYAQSVLIMADEYAAKLKLPSV